MLKCDFYPELEGFPPKKGENISVDIVEPSLMNVIQFGTWQQWIRAHAYFHDFLYPHFRSAFEKVLKECYNKEKENTYSRNVCFEYAPDFATIIHDSLPYCITPEGSGLILCPIRAKTMIREYPAYMFFLLKLAIQEKNKRLFDIVVCREEYCSWAYTYFSGWKTQTRSGKYHFIFHDILTAAEYAVLAISAQSDWMYEYFSSYQTHFTKAEELKLFFRNPPPEFETLCVSCWNDKMSTPEYFGHLTQILQSLFGDEKGFSSFLVSWCSKYQLSIPLRSFLSDNMTQEDFHSIEVFIKDGVVDFIEDKSVVYIMKKIGK